eukprot:363918-Chlamydomonas_euryale.AAC.2
MEGGGRNGRGQTGSPPAKGGTHILFQARQTQNLDCNDGEGLHMFEAAVVGCTQGLLGSHISQCVSQPGGCMDGRTDRRTDRQTDGRVAGWVNGCDAWDGRVVGWVDGWIEGCMSGWMGGLRGV